MKRAASHRLGRAVSGEIERAMANIHLPGHPRPYYISHLLREDEIWQIQGRYGTLRIDAYQRRRDCLTDVRVGSHRHDQVQEGGLDDNSKDVESYEYVTIPVGDKLDGVRHGLWRLTEARYREAIDGFLQKKANEITYLNKNRSLRAFEKREPIVDLSWKKLPELDVDYWHDYVQRASATYKCFPHLKNGHVELLARNALRIFANSEGSLQLHCIPYWSLDLYFWYLSENGDALPYNHTILVTDPAELPDLRGCRKIIRHCTAMLDQLAAAPLVRSFSGPVLLDPVPAGLLVHEALGHRLEGSRLLSSGEGQTFRDSVGQQILPSFLSLRDDPTLETFGGKSLVGHYPYDDEGVPSQDAQLVSKGVLKGFLTSRTPTSRIHKSNGHGRSSLHQRAISRMGVTVLETSNGIDNASVKEKLIEEVKRQGTPYGMRIIKASGGETATGAYDFQAFLGEISLAARVYPDGREELVRGVNFVGTPLNAVRNIIAAGKDYQVDNALCGAESGFVPVSTISPSLLISELELQSKSDTPYTQYVYPMPWETPKA